MVGEQDVVAGCGAEIHNPVCFWLMSSGAGGTSDAVQILSAWITRFGWLCGAEGSIVRNVTGGKTGDDNLLVSNCDRLPLIIQHSYASGGEEIKIILVHHPLVIAEGEKGRCDGGAGRQEGQDVGLGSYRTRIIHWPAAVQNISGNTDEIWMAGAERREHGRWITIM